jgi:hypothetical protein
LDISISKIFSIFGIVSTWAAKALDDNKVTLREAVDLVVPIAAVLGVPTQIDLPGHEAEAIEPEEPPDSFDKTNPDLKRQAYEV